MQGSNTSIFFSAWHVRLKQYYTFEITETKENAANHCKTANNHKAVSPKSNNYSMKSPDIEKVKQKINFDKLKLKVDDKVKSHSDKDKHKHKSSSSSDEKSSREKDKSRSREKDRRDKREHKHKDRDRRDKHRSRSKDKHRHRNENRHKDSKDKVFSSHHSEKKLKTHSSNSSEQKETSKPLLQSSTSGTDLSTTSVIPNHSDSSSLKSNSANSLNHSPSKLDMHSGNEGSPMKKPVKLKIKPLPPPPSNDILGDILTSMTKCDPQI